MPRGERSVDYKKPTIFRAYRRNLVGGVTACIALRNLLGLFSCVGKSLGSFQVVVSNRHVAQ